MPTAGNADYVENHSRWSMHIYIFYREDSVDIEDIIHPRRVTAENDRSLPALLNFNTVSLPLVFTDTQDFFTIES